MDQDRIPGTIPYFLKEKIRRMIVDGTFRPGQPLREQDLERRYDISRGPIREALRLLEHSGLVTHIQRRGFRVTLYNEKEIRDQYLLRAELEGYAMRRLAEIDDLTPLLATLDACRTRLAQAYQEHDARQYLAEIHAFFDAIVQSLNNTPLQDALAKLNEISEPLRYNLLSRKLAESKALDYMRLMTDALKTRDFERAAVLKHEHVLLNLPNIIETYRMARYEENIAHSGQGATANPIKQMR
jgi:DNA-binding GntR family transcriptional regulator